MSRKLFIALLLPLYITCGFCQRAPVTWNFRADRVKAAEWMITMHCTLAPGWHIYSQLLDDGGPIPTSIKLDTSDDYVRVGSVHELGRSVSYYDSTYGMSILYYEGEVNFVQRVILRRMVPEIFGTVEFMVCNDQQCVPHQERFQVNLEIP